MKVVVVLFFWICALLVLVLSIRAEVDEHHQQTKRDGNTSTHLRHHP